MGPEDEDPGEARQVESLWLSSGPSVQPTPTGATIEVCRPSTGKGGAVNAALQLDGIRKTLAGREILKGISFTVAPGDVFGYLGSNGAGKTTTIRILLDLIRATSGDVRVMGESASREDVRRRIGFVLEADGLYNSLSAVENLEFYARIYGAKDTRARIATLLGTSVSRIVRGTAWAASPRGCGSGSRWRAPSCTIRRS